jgi:hypothetical protein
VVEASERGKIELVVADYFNFFSETVGMREFAPLLTSYLRRTFEPVLSVAVDMHLFLRRRPTPLPDRVLGNALADCDVTLPFDWYQRGVYEHLLFLTLYHPLDVPSRPLVRDLSTRCRVRVPEAAALRFFIGLRQPTVVAPGSAVRYALWATPAGAAREPTLLFDEAIAPTPLPGWDSPPPLERLVDLSAWAGAEIELRFQNTYAGQVSMNPLDLRGFVAFWQDVQLESPREASHSR